MLGWEVDWQLSIVWCRQVMGVTISTSASSHNQGPQALPSPQPNEAWDSQCNPKSYYLTFFECKNKTFLLDNKILFALHPICWWAPIGLCCTGLSLHGRSTHKHSNQTKSVILKFWSLESAKWNCYGELRQYPRLYRFLKSKCGKNKVSHSISIW